MSTRKHGKSITEQIHDALSAPMGEKLSEVDNEEIARRIDKLSADEALEALQKVDDITSASLWEIANQILPIASNYPVCDYPYVCAALLKVVAILETQMNDAGRKLENILVEEYQFSATSYPAWLEDLAEQKDENAEGH